MLPLRQREPPRSKMFEANLNSAFSEVCHKCGRQGHIAHQCRRYGHMGGVFRHNCGQLGHISRGCTTPAVQTRVDYPNCVIYLLIRFCHTVVPE
ncbi:hypothetical protein L596_023601 [Steinernema carpocapsae]|uniref:CCHC-type domain-containing protein n=1 Tax=Steinernema carpocapsae TaxID=34508 RepID=A0A4U5ME66_STECR|nr:hypothetical protein L596_023601 [Steinernema carpocapsae]